MKGGRINQLVGIVRHREGCQDVQICRGASQFGFANWISLMLIVAAS